uniref:Uncharacterized protein n=1 Tax=Anopheles stephensi TaxID=30069 RepID=A0A182YIQ8_ANOST
MANQQGLQQRETLATEMLQHQHNQQHQDEEEEEEGGSISEDMDVSGSALNESNRSLVKRKVNVPVNTQDDIYKVPFKYGWKRELVSARRTLSDRQYAYIILYLYEF